MSAKRLATVMVLVVATGFIGGYAQYRWRESRDLTCLSNLCILGAASQMYLADFNDTLPPAENWVDDLLVYTRSGSGDVTKCPFERSAARSSYGLNALVAGKPYAQIEDPGRTVLFYETAHPGDNPSGGSDDVVTPVRHVPGNAYTYCNGVGGRWSMTVPRFDPGKPPRMGGATGAVGETQPARIARRRAARGGRSSVTVSQIRSRSTSK